MTPKLHGAPPTFPHPTKMPSPAFLLPLPQPARARRSPRARWLCTTSEHPPAGAIATGPNARRLAKWLAADWANRAQSMDNPAFWAHIHVCFRPLPWQLLDAYALYCESAYDFNLGAPYKSSVVQIVNDGKGQLELVSYKLKDPQEYWLAAHEPELLEPLTREELVQMPDACNTVYEFDEGKGVYMAYSRPGKGCRICRGGKEKETYLNSKIMLTEDQYAAWDLGLDPETDERVWGTAAGPFVFSALERLDHVVPEEPATVASSPS